MDYKKRIEIIFAGRNNGLLALFIAINASILIYITNYQRNYVSKRYVLFTLLFFVTLTFVAGWLNRSVLGKFFQRTTRQQHRLCFSLAVVLSLILLSNFKILPFYLLEENTTVTLELVPSEARAGEPARVTYVRNTLGFIPFTELNLSGGWKTDSASLLIEDGKPLSWSGKFKDFLEIGFRPTVEPGIIRISIDGVGYDQDLQQKNSNEEIIFRFREEPSLLSRIPFVVTFLIVVVYLLILLFSLAFLQPVRLQDSISLKSSFWFGLPLLISCGFALLVFWPGMMSKDSMGVWGQAVTHSFTDWHPIFQTFLISLLIKIWYSPAFIALLQLLTLCLVLVWGLDLLRKSGVPPAALWIIACLFAIFPPNMIIPITLWKDTVYSIALLSWFIAIMQIALSSGRWLSEKKGWIVLAITGFCVAIFRQNGLIVAIFSMGLLLVFLKKNRKEVLLGLMITLVAGFGVLGLLNLKIDSPANETSQANLILLPHIAAHVDAGTELNEEEKSYLNGLMPLSQWEYDCCYVGNISYNQAFDRQTFLKNFPKNLGVALDLFSKDPGIDLDHQLCASEMVWKFRENRCSLKSLHAFNKTRLPNVSWIQDNNYGLQENSFIPAMIPFYLKIFQSTGMLSGYPIFVLKPAFYLCLSFVMIAAASLKRRNLLLLLVPIIVQSASLALIIFAPSFRYQYGICLIGLFSLGLYFIPAEELNEKKQP